MTKFPSHLTNPHPSPTLHPILSSLLLAAVPFVLSFVSSLPSSWLSPQTCSSRPGCISMCLRHIQHTCYCWASGQKAELCRAACFILLPDLLDKDQDTFMTRMKMAFRLLSLFLTQVSPSSPILWCCYLLNINS